MPEPASCPHGAPMYRHYAGPVPTFITRCPCCESDFGREPAVSSKECRACDPDAWGALDRRREAEAEALLRGDPGPRPGPP
jgi:hypothetical protein